MKSRHITKILDQTALADLSAEDLTIVRAHAENCPDCRQALKAARVSSVLLKTGGAREPLAPSAFFQTKVLNALREKQNSAAKPIAAFRRWWQASVAMVFLMLVTVAGLAAITLLAPDSSASEAQADAPNFNLYSTDAVILNQKPSDLTNEQVLQVIYNTRNDARKQR